MSQTHSDRTRMQRDVQLTELNPYYHSGDQGQDNELRWRSKWELEEWAYEQGYDSTEQEFWQMCPSGIANEIGYIFMSEGEKPARMLYNEEIERTVQVMVSERLETYVDGQFRMFAGYEVAENGDTLEEGNHGDWEHLRMMWEAGLQDKLRDNEKYSSIRD